MDDKNKMAPAELDAIVDYLKNKKLVLVTAESVTAGLIASTLAEPSGCGSWLDSAFVTYSEEAKIECLEVSPETIDEYGLTSVEIAEAMARGALKQSGANVAIATTGLAGPSSGDGEDPVGTICLAWVFKTDDRIHVETEKTWFDGERNTIRAAASFHALRKLIELHKNLN